MTNLTEGPGFQMETRPFVISIYLVRVFSPPYKLKAISCKLFQAIIYKQESYERNDHPYRQSRGSSKVSIDRS